MSSAAPAVALVAALGAVGCSPAGCADLARWFRYAYRATGVPHGMCEIDHRVRRVALVDGPCADDAASQWAVSCLSCPRASHHLTPRTARSPATARSS